MESETQSTLTPPVLKNNKLLMLLVSLGVLVLLTIIGYLFHQNRLLRKEISNIQVQPDFQVQPATEPAAENDPKAGWETYINTQYKFSFKYPISYKETPYQEGNFRGVQISGTSSGSSLLDGVMIKTLAIASGLSAKAFAEEQWQKDQNQPDFTATGSITPIKTITIDGKIGYAYDVSFMGNVKVVIVPLSDNTVLRIAEYYAGSDDQLPNYEKTLGQILSTFRFLK